jgi:hypothetical protein
MQNQKVCDDKLLIQFAPPYLKCHRYKPAIWITFAVNGIVKYRPDINMKLLIMSPGSSCIVVTVDVVKGRQYSAYTVLHADAEDWLIVTSFDDSINHRDEFDSRV